MPSRYEQFVEYLDSQGRGMTVHLEKAVHTILEATGLFRPETIIEHLEGKVSLATVHRALNHMVKARLLGWVRLKGEKLYYQIEP